MKYERRDKNSKEGDLIKRFTGSWIGSVMFLILSGILFYNIVKSIIITTEKLEILNQAETEVADLRLSNLELILLEEYMTSDEYLETEARNRLNLGKKGEVSFVISGEMLDRGRLIVQGVLGEEGNVDTGDNWIVWYDFFKDRV